MFSCIHKWLHLRRGQAESRLRHYVIVVIDRNRTGWCIIWFSIFIYFYVNEHRRNQVGAWGGGLEKVFVIRLGQY